MVQHFNKGGYYRIILLVCLLALLAYCIFMYK